VKPIHFLFRSRNLSCLLVLVSAFYFQVNIRATSADLNALGGRWKFNQAKSDNPQAKLDAALGDGNAFMLALKRKQAQAALQQFITATEALTITCQPEAVTIMAQGRPSRTLYLDGRKQDFESPNGSKNETTTQWRNGQLIVKSVNSKGAHITQTYELVSGTRQLQMLIRVEHPQLSEPLVLRNLYDPMKE
jgi:hypothetical protein